MYANTRDKFIFLSNPRCGSESLRAMLQPYTQQFTLDQHLLAVEVRHLLPIVGWRWEDFYTFTTIRNPWSRLVSAYHHWETNPQSAFAYAAGMSFSEFVARPETELLARRFCIKSFAFDGVGQIVGDIFRVEDMAVWAPKLADRLGLSSFDIQHINKTRHDDYRPYYDDTSRGRVASMFSGDIEVGDYQF